jgi:Transcriptional regulators of sugar metabolism
MPKQRDAIFAEIRKQEIVSMVNANGLATVNELCSHFSVSPATIRTDLNELEHMGILKRTHGGAISNNILNYEPTSQEKEEQYVAQKKAISLEALNYVKPGDTIAIDTGTTTLAFAKAIVSIPNLTVITNDLLIATYLEQSANTTVLLLGGYVRAHFHCTIGQSVVDEISNLHIDTAFIATNGISAECGLSTPNMEIANIKREMIKRSQKTVVLVDSSKIGKNALIMFATFDKVDVLITDTDATSDFVSAVEKNGVRVVFAKSAD